jgi:Flp pilus assembly protein TadG
MTKGRDSGETLVEFAIAISLFLLLVVGTIDFAYLFYTKLTLQSAVRQAGRYAITGQCVTNADGTCKLTRYNSIVQTLQNASFGLLNNANAGDIKIACTNNGGGCPNNAGGPGDIITITVTYTYNFLTKPISGFFVGGVYTFSVTAAFNNEPFPPDQS